MKQHFEYATPESVGVPSGKIIEFIEELSRERYHTNSFMLIKDDKVITEAYYAPFVPQDQSDCIRPRKT